MAGIEAELAKVYQRWLGLVPATVRGLLVRRNPTIDCDATDIEVYGSNKDRIGWNYAGVKCGRVHWPAGPSLTAPPRSRPRLGDLSQRTEVDLGVEGGSGQVLVTKHLADRDQAGPLAQQLRRQGVPQPVRPHPWQPGSQAGPLHDITDGSARIGPRGARQVRNSWGAPARARCRDR